MIMKRAWQAEAWFCLLMGVLLIAWALSGCKSPDMPRVDVKFWAGDSANDGISRSQEGKTISCASPEFDEMACLTYTDMKKIFDLLLQCERWPRSAVMMTKRDKQRFLRENNEVIHHVVQASDRETQSLQP